MFLTMVFLMAQRFRSGQDSARLGCGHNTYRQFDRPPAQKAPSQDPILILRERFARGEITTDEFKQQVDEVYALSTVRQFPGAASDPRQWATEEERCARNQFVTRDCDDCRTARALGSNTFC